MWFIIVPLANEHIAILVYALAASMSLAIDPVAIIDTSITVSVYAMPLLHACMPVAIVSAAIAVGTFALAVRLIIQLVSIVTDEHHCGFVAFCKCCSLHSGCVTVVQYARLKESASLLNV
jgi:hypothetical protein